MKQNVLGNYWTQIFSFINPGQYLPQIKMRIVKQIGCVDAALKYQIVTLVGLLPRDTEAMGNCIHILAVRVFSSPTSMEGCISSLSYSLCVMRYTWRRLGHPLNEKKRFFSLFFARETPGTHLPQDPIKATANTSSAHFDYSIQTHYVTYI